jgi:hypothetical protein
LTWRDSFLLIAKNNLKRKGEKIVMTRFEKEMRKHFSRISFDADIYGEKSAYCIAEKALVVFCHPSIITVLRFERNGKQTEVTNDYPRISAPYLVLLCGGDEEHAKRILKAQHF